MKEKYVRVLFCFVIGIIGGGILSSALGFGFGIGNVIGSAVGVGMAELILHPEDWRNDY